MYSPKRSNCNVWAWEMFRRGHADTLCFKKTKYSKWEDLAKTRLWKVTLLPIGYILGYPLWALVQVSWLLMFGTWAHVTTGTHEYVPLEDKRKRWFGPMGFKGQVQEIHNERT